MWDAATLSLSQQAMVAPGPSTPRDSAVLAELWLTHELTCAF